MVSAEALTNVFKYTNRGERSMAVLSVAIKTHDVVIHGVPMEENRNLFNKQHNCYSDITNMTRLKDTFVQ